MFVSFVLRSFLLVVIIFDNIIICMVLKILYIARYIVLYFSECTNFRLNLLDCEFKLSCMVPYEPIIYFHHGISIFYSI